MTCGSASRLRYQSGWQVPALEGTAHQAAVGPELVDDRLVHAGARAWRAALEPLTPDQRGVFVETFKAYEDALDG
ncbi:hypothetical protein LZG04_02845 [Saccharothrix sp. S26]|uniref:hypothetical protein n=1 Tax=Saccharothrix sp. S26 TaxID=2907215 RepID=UPI001F3CC6CD|nr:hypothetical protein [Saccharothrix sp. S26]MCE6993750.1 hypothetical protein [Saccharothrix sp. S26]